MHLSTWLLADATPLPTPTMTVNPDQVTPGFIGFVGIAVIALAVVALLADMLRRIRRAGYRADIRDELDAEQAQAAVRNISPAGDAGEDVTPERPAKD